MDKKARSEALRLESLKRKKEERKKLDALITSDLNSQSSSKKIKFTYSDDEDSDNDPQSSGKIKDFDAIEEFSKNDSDAISMPSHVRKIAKKPNDLNFDDPRFKIDEKFAFSDSDESSSSKEMSCVNSGKDINDVASKSKIVDGKFFEIDRSFADELRSKASHNTENTGFSFLAMIGRSDEDYTMQEHGDNGVVKQPEKKNLHIIAKQNGNTKQTNTKLPLLSSQKKSQFKFFLTGNEPHVKSVVANFRQTQSIEKTVGLWSNYRDSIMKIYRHQRKKARKQLREEENRKQQRPYQTFKHTEEKAT